MAGADILDTPLTAGVNQGIERTVLPLPQLSVVQNARMRKGSRWGKRFGHTALSTTNLGTGTGNFRCMGGARSSCFAIVDDQCSGYNQTAAAFIAPSATVPTAAGANPRVAGAVSGWLPNNSFFPVPARALSSQKTTPCSSAYAIGYLWTAIQYEDPGNAGDQLIRIVATDPTDQALVYLFEFSGNALSGGVAYPKLIACGSTLVVTYLKYSAGVPQVGLRSLTSIAGGFSVETIPSAATVNDYDASAYSSTQFLLSSALVGGSCKVALFTASTLAIGANFTFTDSSTNQVTNCSVVGSPAAGIYLGYGVFTTPSTNVRVYTAGLGALVGTAILTGLDYRRPLLALSPAGGVRCIFSVLIQGAASPSAFGIFRFRNVSAAAVAGARTMRQLNAYPISIPFAVGLGVYAWTKTELGNNGYATLIRLPDPDSFPADAITSCPLEMSVQDFLVSTGRGLTETDLKGVPTVAQIGASATYAVPVPTLYTSASATVVTGNDFRILQATHYSDTAARRSLGAIYADSGCFVPMGALTNIGDRGATEEGYVHAPAVYPLIPAAGGGMTPTATYYYSAVYKARNSNGRLEVSAPATPVKVVMGAGQGTNQVQISALGITARPSVQIEVYRTLANGQTFYLNNVFDSSGNTVVYSDAAADASISTQAVLYTQVGQTLPNVLPPPSRFGCVGGARLWLGGLMRGDVAQASKLIFGDQSPSFADSDAFRVVVPETLTGIAFMDSPTFFTRAGIYVVSGGGPDDSGNGDFGDLTQMPYAIGCIEPRSVVTVDDGTFFQSSRGLYLLPRGFGAPVPAGDVVMDTLAAYPVITGVATITKSTEQAVYWSCTTTQGDISVRIVYDLAHKVWSTDVVAGGGGLGMGQWSGDEVATFSGNLADAAPLVTNSAFTDGPSNYAMTLTTGDLRPFGLLSEGVISKVDLLVEGITSCTLQVNKTTDNGNSPTSSVAITGGRLLTTIETELGNAELRDVGRLRVTYSETSATEGLALIALAIEHEQGEGLRRVSDLNRTT